MEIKKYKFDFRRFFFLYGIRFLIAFFVALLIFILIFVLTGPSLLSATNGAFYSLVIMLIAAFGSYATNAGFFDIVAYSGLRFLKRFTKSDKIHADFYGTYDYTKSKETVRRESKKVFLVYLIVALLYLILTLILYLIYKLNY